MTDWEKSVPFIYLKGNFMICFRVMMYKIINWNWSSFQKSDHKTWRLWKKVLWIVTLYMPKMIKTPLVLGNVLGKHLLSTSSKWLHEKKRRKGKSYTYNVGVGGTHTPTILLGALASFLCQVFVLTSIWEQERAVWKDSLWRTKGNISSTLETTTYLGKGMIKEGKWPQSKGANHRGSARSWDFKRLSFWGQDGSETSCIRKFRIT